MNIHHTPLLEHAEETLIMEESFSSPPVQGLTQPHSREAVLLQGSVSRMQPVVQAREAQQTSGPLSKKSKPTINRLQWLLEVSQSRWTSAHQLRDGTQTHRVFILSPQRKSRKTINMSPFYFHTIHTWSHCVVSVIASSSIILFYTFLALSEEKTHMWISIALNKLCNKPLELEPEISKKKTPYCFVV